MTAGLRLEAQPPPPNSGEDCTRMGAWEPPGENPPSIVSSCRDDASHPAKIGK